MPIPFGGQGHGWGGGQMRRRLSDMFGGSGGFGGGGHAPGMGLSNLMARMGQMPPAMNQPGGMAPVSTPAITGPGIVQAPQPMQGMVPPRRRFGMM